MRKRLARWLAFATGSAILILSVVFAILQNPAGDPPAGAAPPQSDRAPAAPTPEPPEREPDTAAPVRELLERGRSVYGEQGCRVCHSIGGEGGRRSALDGVGSRLTTEEIRLWIVAPQQMKPGVRKPAYDDLAEEDIEALVTYLASLP